MSALFKAELRPVDLLLMAAACLGAGSYAKQALTYHDYQPNEPTGSVVAEGSAKRVTLSQDDGNNLYSSVYRVSNGRLTPVRHELHNQGVVFYMLGAGVAGALVMGVLCSSRASRDMPRARGGSHRLQKTSGLPPSIAAFKNSAIAASSVR